METLTTLNNVVVNSTAVTEFTSAEDDAVDAVKAVDAVEAVDAVDAVVSVESHLITAGEPRPCMV